MCPVLQSGLQCTKLTFGFRTLKTFICPDSVPVSRMGGRDKEMWHPSESQTSAFSAGMFTDRKNYPCQ
jgi:hypothetical protein